jgi:hypothetical protein
LKLDIFINVYNRNLRISLELKIFQEIDLLENDVKRRFL